MPTHIVFGSGKVKEVGSYVKTLGKIALVVTGKTSAKKMGYTDMVIDSLKKFGVESIVFNEVEQEPSTITIDRGAEIARENNVDVVIGLGGGSAMDAAKGIAFGAENEGSITDYMEGKKGIEALPIVLITTTAGTGSEANNTAVFTNSDTKIKKSFRSLDLFPEYSIVDPELMLTLPKDVTASTGIDVFFHAFEAYIGKKSQPMTEIVALEAIRLVKQNLLKVCEDGSNLKCREKMAWANTLAGMAINLSGTCGIHALGQTIGGLYDIAHGRSLSAVACSFMRFSAPEIPDKISRVAEIFGIETKKSSKEKVAKDFIKTFENLLKELNLPRDITTFGVKKHDVDMLAEITLRTRKSSIMSSPKTPTFDQIREMFFDSL